MRQVVSLIKDNQAHFALVDEEDGSIIPFADLLIPDPDRFGLHESAVLGTNLISALGLNGHKRAKAHVMRVGDELPAVNEAPALEAPRPPKNETSRERRNRIARERYERQKSKAGKATSPSAKPHNSAQRYVSIDEVMGVVNQYPEGIRVTEVAERLWRETDGKGTDTPYPNWFYTAISNRLTNARKVLADRGTPKPFREEDRPIPDKDGNYLGAMGKYLMPAAVPESRPEPQAFPLT